VPCLRQLPHFQEQFNEYKDKGVHFFAIEGEGLSMRENQAFAGEWEVTVPIVTAADSKLDGYDVKTMPAIYVINPFGRVVFQGSGDYEKFLQAALKDVKYPNLGKTSVTPECEKAAEAFGKGDYATAAKLADALLATEPAEAVASDARHISDRCKAVAKSLREEADTAKADGRYVDAITALDMLAARFKGDELATKADEESKALAREKDAKAEIKARKDLAKVLAANKKLRVKDDKLSALYKFYEKNEGTAAASDAKEMAEAIKASAIYR